MFNRSSVHSAVARTLGATALLSCPLALAITAQTPQRGPRHVDPRWHALVHATLIPAPGEEVEDATIVLRDGLIVSVESGAAAPDGARVWDCSGLYVYAGLIEPYFEVEAPAPDQSGAHWNALITPQRSALDGDGISQKDRETLRELGFATACLVPDGGILRGSSALVSLGEPETDTAAESAQLLASDLYQVFSFDRAPYLREGNGRSGAGDPSSEMGAIALLRQCFSDAVWHAQSLDVYRIAPGGNEPPQAHDALVALGTASSGAPLLFDADNELQVLRAARLAAEFGRELMVLGSGREYRRLDAMRELGVPILCPVSFPAAPDVETLAEAEQVDLRTLMGWEQAPTNPRRLLEAGIESAFTSSKLKSRGKDFWPNLRKAILHGLTERDALAMLTTRTARLLGVELEGGLGRVSPGYQAHLLVADGELFAEDTKIRDLWVGGRRYEIESAPAADHKGHWTGALAESETRDPIEVRLLVEKKKLTLTAFDEELEGRAIQRENERLHFLFDGDVLGIEGTWSFSGQFESDVLFGTLVDPAGGLIAVRLERDADPADSDSETDEQESEATDSETEQLADIPDDWPLPFGAFGLNEMPPQEDLLLTNATVWTSGPRGILEQAAVLISGGRIQYVGPASEALDTAARTIDLAGAHLTPGLIDCHSHTGISGAVNEMGQRVTAEVRINDVIDPDDINWYRQLAGGLTAANQLHGSGNAVGGQNSVVKLRWGVQHPDGMRLAGAIPGIKFALGENPKRVAQNTDVADEYPQTRMGVATLIRDRLLAGREYRASFDRFRALPDEVRLRTMPPRRDLELEALGEITARERLIHCHSYRQDEILMLCRTAQELGFKIGTFQHVLEGYKVADAIAEAALGASTFADWWAYKFEVVDAIPSNAGLMHDVGVVASINSDSADHARRLNTEAAKSVKYAGLSPAEALELVTLNPAIQLGIEHRVGSIEVGKDADLAVWSGDPLSYRSRCERTYVDGRELFSLERDDELRVQAQRERHRIIQKILASDSPDKDADDEGSSDEDDEDPDRTHFSPNEEWLRAGLPIGTTLPGDCGLTHHELQTGH